MLIRLIYCLKAAFRWKTCARNLVPFNTFTTQVYGSRKWLFVYYYRHSLVCIVENI